MRWSGSIESRHGVDEPGYQPPTDQPVTLRAERRGFGPIDALWCILIPLIGVVMAVTRFARDEVGPGFACLLCSAVGFAGWALALPAAASAVTIQGPASDAMLPRLREWAATSAIPTPNVPVNVVPQACDAETTTCTMRNTQPFRLYFPDLNYLWTQNSTTRDQDLTHLSFMHELGHIYDFAAHTHYYRVRFLAILRIVQRSDSPRGIALRSAPAGWMGAWDAHGDFVEPDEQFAMAFSYCAAGLSFPAMTRVFHGTYWGYGYNPTGPQYARVCTLLRPH